jgi:CHRD domain
MRQCLSVVVAVVAAVFVLAGPALAADSFGARLRGAEETPVPISTPGQGFFFASLNNAETQLDYTLVYFGLGSTVTQSHIHFGPPGIGGGIVLFLCSNNPPITPPASVPTPPACPNGPGINTVNGTLTAANVIAVQGIPAGGFADIINAMRGNLSYANVHTTGFGGGEIRGIITR